MPDYQYPQFASNWVSAHRCGESGQTSPETASLAIQYLQSSLGAYTYDAVRLDKVILEMDGLTPTDATCNRMAMEVASVRRRIDQNNAAVESNQKAWADVLKSSTPKQTYCNKIGTQTLCTTY